MAAFYITVFAILGMTDLEGAFSTFEFFDAKSVDTCSPLRVIVIFYHSGKSFKSIEDVTSYREIGCDILL